jgi:hypothetical protein
MCICAQEKNKMEEYVHSTQIPMLSAKVNRGVTQEYERHKSKNTT